MVSGPWMCFWPKVSKLSFSSPMVSWVQSLPVRLQVAFSSKSPTILISYIIRLPFVTKSCQVGWSVPKNTISGDDATKPALHPPMSLRSTRQAEMAILVYVRNKRILKRINGAQTYRPTLYCAVIVGNFLPCWQITHNLNKISSVR
jgi:hypothetical protein